MRLFVSIIVNIAVNIIISLLGLLHGEVLSHGYPTLSVLCSWNLFFGSEVIFYVFWSSLFSPCFYTRLLVFNPKPWYSPRCGFAYIRVEPVEKGDASPLSCPSSSLLLRIIKVLIERLSAARRPFLNILGA